LIVDKSATKNTVFFFCAPDDIQRLVLEKFPGKIILYQIMHSPTNDTNEHK